MVLLLPPVLQAADDDRAIALVGAYMATNGAVTGGVEFTGSKFDTWAGGGARPDTRDHFTDDDINAVAMLSVEIPAPAVIEIIETKRLQLSALLADIPVDVDLASSPANLVGPGSAAAALWDVLEGTRHVGWVTAGKLCARKRAQLLPVYDKFVRDSVGDPDSFWLSLREALQRDDKALAVRLAGIGAAAGASHLSAIRVFDIVTWLSAKRARGAGT